MRPLLLAGLAVLAACAGPKPCTRTLCVSRLDGSLELSGWSGRVRADSGTPQPPVMSDTLVTIVSGNAEFRNGKTTVSAAEGAAFRFTVSTRAVAAIEVTSGAVSVAPSSGAPVAVSPGAPYALPKP